MMDRLLFALAFLSAGFMIGVTLIPVDSLVGTVPPTMEPYAQISDLTTQACAAGGAAADITLNTNDAIFGMIHSTSSNTHKITVRETGIYQVIAVPQVGEAIPQASGTHNMWMMKNGDKVPNSNIKTTVSIQQTGVQTMTGTLNWVGKLNQNDYISFQQGCDDPHIGIIFTSGATPPATPSIIISVAKIS